MTIHSQGDLELSVGTPNPAQEVEPAASAEIASADSVAKTALKSTADTALKNAQQGTFGKVKKPKVPCRMPRLRVSRDG